HAALVTRGSPFRLLKLQRLHGAMKLIEFRREGCRRRHGLAAKFMHPFGTLDRGTKPCGHVGFLYLPVHPLLPRCFLLGFKRLQLTASRADGLITAGPTDA